MFVRSGIFFLLQLEVSFEKGGLCFMLTLSFQYIAEIVSKSSFEMQTDLA